MRNSFTLPWLIITLVVIAGCSSVTTTKPLGESASIEQAKKLVGIWTTPKDDPLFVQHVADNELRVASIEWKDGSYQLHELTVLVTQDEGQLFVNLQSKDSATYSFMRVRLAEENLMILKPVNVAAFQAAVEQGQLTGTVEKGEHATHVKLTPTGTQLDDFISPDKAAEQCALDDALVLRRLKDTSKVTK